MIRYAYRSNYPKEGMHGMTASPHGLHVLYRDHQQAIAERDAVIRGLIDAGDAVADVDAPRFPAWEAAVAKAREALATS